MGEKRKGNWPRQEAMSWQEAQGKSAVPVVSREWDWGLGYLAFSFTGIQFITYQAKKKEPSWQTPETSRVRTGRRLI